MISPLAKDRCFCTELHHYSVVNRNASLYPFKSDSPSCDISHIALYLTNIIGNKPLNYGSNPCDQDCIINDYYYILIYAFS